MKRLVKQQQFLLLLLLLVGTIPITLVLLLSRTSLFSHANEKLSCQTITDIPKDHLISKNERTSILESLHSAAIDTDFPVQGDTISSKLPIPVLQDALLKRKKFLLQTMEFAPEKALDTIYQDFNNHLNTVTFTCTPQPTTLEGELLVGHADDENGEVSQMFYQLTTKDGKEYSIHLARGREPSLTSGMSISAKGYLLDGSLVVDTAVQDAVVIKSHSLESRISSWFASLTPKAHAAVSAALGPQRVLVLLVNFNNTPLPALSTDTAASTTFTTINNYFQEVSNGKTSIVGTINDVKGWYTLPIAATCDTGIIATNAIKAADPDVDFTQYKRVAFVAHFNDTYNSCGWAGYGYFGATTYSTADGSVPLYRTYVGSQYMTSSYLRILSHELGHTFGGVNHSRFLNCGSLSLATSGCTTDEYGDKYSMMGSGNNGHFTASHKEYIGWFNPGNLLTITSSGTFNLEPYETNTSGLKVLKIPRPNNDYLYVEYRQPIGTDSSLYSDGFQGALIHTISGNYSNLIETSPPGNYQSSSLKVGQTFTDPATNVSLTVTNRTATALTIQVAYPNQSITPTPTLKPTNTPTPIPTNTPTPKPTNTPTPLPTNTPTLSATNSPIPSAITPTTTIKGDFNGSGSTDLLDFNLWRDEFSGVKTTKLSDGNHDGNVDLLDFNLWLTAFNGG